MKIKSESKLVRFKHVQMFEFYRWSGWRSLDIHTKVGQTNVLGRWAHLFDCNGIHKAIAIKNRLIQKAPCVLRCYLSVTFWLKFWVSKVASHLLLFSDTHQSPHPIPIELYAKDSLKKSLLVKSAKFEYMELIRSDSWSLERVCRRLERCN